jgi:hypothetical protein
MQNNKNTEHLIFKVQETSSPRTIMMDIMTDVHTGSTGITKEKGGEGEGDSLTTPNLIHRDPQ